LEEAVEYYVHLTRLAEDLMLLARADAGRLSLKCERISLDKTIADVVDLYAASAAELGVELRMHHASEVFIRGDSARIRQLIGNILDNALKYIGEGKSIQVTLARTNGHVRVSVEDDGVGIPAESLPHLFDRFFRVDRARSHENVYGAGLGLAICESIAKAHQGRISIQSRLGSGTRVVIELPDAEKHCDSLSDESLHENSKMLQGIDVTAVD
jgi:signal transduction histidine kinase